MMCLLDRKKCYQHQRFNVLLLRTMITQYPVFSPSINALMIVQSTLGKTIEVFNVKFARRFALGLAYE